MTKRNLKAVGLLRPEQPFVTSLTRRAGRVLEQIGEVRSGDSVEVPPSTLVQLQSPFEKKQLHPEVLVEVAG